MCYLIKLNKGGPSKKKILALKTKTYFRTGLELVVVSAGYNG